MIGDDIAAALPELRSQAESLMRDKITVERPGKATADAKGADQVPYTTVYTGKARIKSSPTTSVVGANRSAAIAGTVTIASEEVHLPADAPEIRVGDVVTVTSSQWQPRSVGRKYRVTATHEQTLQTARRLRVERWV